MESIENLVGAEPNKSRWYHLAILKAGKGVEIAMGQSSKDYLAREKLNELTE